MNLSCKRKFPVFVVTLFFVISAGSTSSAYSMVINELMPNPSENDEWIELYNETLDPVDLADWQLIDMAGNIGYIYNEVDFGTVIVPSDGYLVVAKDEETLDLLNIPDHQRVIVMDLPILNNDGDRLRLVNSVGVEEDCIAYDSEATSVAGRSWERIDPNRSGTDPDNWGPSASGHSAGRVNSLKPVAPGVRLSVYAEPNPFNPYDGELTQIHFTLPVEVARLTVDVYDLHSRRIRRLSANIPAGMDQPLITWDGRDDRGRMMPIGRYIIIVEAVDLRGGETYTARCTVVSAE